MSSRKEQKEAARAAREAKERELAAEAAKKRRLSIIGGVIGLAVIAAVVAVIVSSSTSTKSTSADAKTVNETYAGIPQNGNVLGEPSAKATIVEFADLRCPYCKDLEVGAMTTIVDELVKTGKAKVVFRNLTMLDGASPSGENSSLAAKYAGAAGLQNKMFPFINLLYINQGLENQDWVTEAVLMDTAKQITGLDAAKAWENRENPKVTALLKKAEEAAQEMNVTGTPTLFVGKDEASATKVSMNDLSDAQPVIDAVNRLQ